MSIYTEEQIRAMEYGRSMDMLIARELGWSFYESYDPGDNLCLSVTDPDGNTDFYNFGNRRYDPQSGIPVDLVVNWDHVSERSFPMYSWDIEAAWSLVEYLKDVMHHDVVITVRRERIHVLTESSNHGPQYRATADTFPLAISRAFLLARRA